MPLFSCALALAAVTVIYLAWRSYITALLERRKELRERIAYMLWVMADADTEEGPFREKRSSPVDTPADVA
jgi:hypothetical protein